jgi:hypothetical protein
VLGGVLGDHQWPEELLELMPGLLAVVLDHPDQQQRQPAEIEWRGRSPLSAVPRRVCK